MKKIETLVKTLENMVKEENLTTTNEYIKSHFVLDAAKEYFDDEIIKAEITPNKILSMLVFDELKKALDKKDKFTLQLDANIEFSKMHLSCKYLVDYYSLLDSDNKRAIQFYVTANAKKGDVHFRLCTSCRKTTREQFEALENELLFNVKRDKKTNRAKTSERKNVAYADIVDVVNTVLNNNYKVENAAEVVAE